MQRAFGCRTCTVNYHQLVNSVAIWAEIQSFQSVYPNLHSTCMLLGGHGRSQCCRTRSRSLALPSKSET